MCGLLINLCCIVDGLPLISPFLFWERSGCGSVFFMLVVVLVYTVHVIIQQCSYQQPLALF